ncbi:bifunctional Ubiquitin-associated domain/E3 ubiquitin ligase [Babesia duncani]|uniref:HECT-type E3 ubiquitin transferase n=1 Tax=Babesia duncani TaxID=323732 RepID=A0AAD9UPT1_9APIC|nr:bifunctional Ubiquitin-associated domain/E3 ubiquitin ligase [Babesia duncani]
MKIGLPRGDNYKLVLAGLQSSQRAFIECLATCPESDLIIHLDSFTQWVWEKSDLICWGPVLNRFDTIISQYIKSYREYIASPTISLDQAFCWDQIQLVKSALKASIMIVENCTSKSLYNSLDLLVMLLDDLNPDIVLATTRLLCVFFSTRNRKHALHKDAGNIAAKLNSLVQSPLPDKTMHIVSSDSNLDAPHVNEVEDEMQATTNPPVLQFYLDSKEHLLKVESTIEVVSNETIKIPIVDIFNCHSNSNEEVTTIQQLKIALCNLHASLQTPPALFQHLWKTLQTLVAKYNIPPQLYTELKYKVLKVFGCIFPHFMRSNINIRISSLICMLLMNNSLYNQFLAYNPSFLLELTSFIRCHRQLERQTMMLATELLSGMIYDGIQYKALSNLLGFNIPHGIFVKVLLAYLEHEHVKEPLPPVMNLKAGTEPRFELQQHANLNEKQLMELQLKGYLVNGDQVLDKYKWPNRILTDVDRQRILEIEDDMRILLQLLIVYYSIISYHGNNNVLVNITLLESIVGFIRVRDPVYLPVVIYVVQVLEALLDYNQTVSRNLRNDLQLFHVFVSRLQYDMYNISCFPIFGKTNAANEWWPNGWLLPQTLDPIQLRFYWLSLSENSARRFLFKTIIKDLDSAARSYTGRTEVHEQDVFAAASPIIPIMHYIFRNVQSWGLGIYSAAITLISDTLGEDPIAQEELHKLGILPAFLLSICDENFKNEDCLSIIPTAISDVFLHKSGQEYMKNKEYAPVLKMIDIITQVDFVLFDRFGEVASAIGSCLDSIARNNETAYPFIMRRIIKIMNELLEDALKYPRFEPLDAKQCEVKAQSYLKDLTSQPHPIGIQILSVLGEQGKDFFYADRIANLGKMLAAFLTGGQSISQFVSMDGVKILLQLSTVPCLPPMFFLIYPQHPLALVLKYITSHAAAPCISHLHSLCRPYLLAPGGNKIPQNVLHVHENIDYFKMIHGVCHFLYFMHRESTSFYQSGCSGQFQTQGITLSCACEIHLTLSLFLKRMIIEFPLLMKQFFSCINAAGVEAILSGGHHSHDHPQIKAHKLHSVQTKIDSVFSANDFFWSSQCSYAYSIPNPSFTMLQTQGQLPSEYASMNSEMCRLVLITVKALMNAINVAATKALGLAKGENGCIKSYIANHISLASSIIVNLFKGIPVLDTWEPGHSVFMENMDQMMMAQYLVECVEIVFKFLIDARGSAYLHILSFLVFENINGMDAVIRTYNYIQALYISACFAMVSKFNQISLDELLPKDTPQRTIAFIKATSEVMGKANIRDLRSCLVVLLKALQVSLNIFSKLSNSRTILNTNGVINVQEYLNSGLFKTFVSENVAVDKVIKHVVDKAAFSCWNWFIFLVKLPSELPCNSCANVHFFISPKLIGAMLKLLTHFMDYHSDARQSMIKSHLDSFGGGAGGGSVNFNPSRLLPFSLNSTTTNQSSRSRQRRHRNLGVAQADSASPEVEMDNEDDNRDMQAARSHLIEMGFSERDISNAIAHCGFSDVATLTDWLINSLSYGHETPFNSEMVENLLCMEADVDDHEDVELPVSTSVLNLGGRLGLFPDTMQPVDANSASNASIDVWDWEFCAFTPKLDVVNGIGILEQISGNIVDGILQLSCKMSSSLSIFVECLLRLANMNVEIPTDIPPLITNKYSKHECNIFRLLKLLINRIRLTSASLAAEIDCGNWHSSCGTMAYIFTNEQEKLTAINTLVNPSVNKRQKMYNAQRLHEHLYGLYYVLTYFIGGKESFSTLLLDFGMEPLQDTLDIVSKCLGVLKSQMLSIKMINSLPNSHVYIPAAMHNVKSDGYTSDDVAFGFFKTGTVPQEMMIPPFIKLGIITIAEMTRIYSLVDLPRELGVALKTNIDVASIITTKWIPIEFQKALVNISLNILELFPGLDPDITCCLLWLLDTLTEQHHNALEFLSYTRLRNIGVKGSKSTQRTFASKSEGSGALCVLLTLDKSCTCKGMLKMVANIIIHCMEDPGLLRDTVQKKLVECLTVNNRYRGPFNPQEECISLAKLIEQMHPYIVRDPKLVIDLIGNCCVLIRTEDDEENVYVTLANNPKLPNVKSIDDMFKGPVELNYKRAFSLMRTIVDHMQMFANLHGCTRSVDSKGENLPSYPFAFTVNSLLYLFGSFYYNFPDCIFHGSTSGIKLEADCLFARLPWKMVDFGTGSTSLKNLIVVVLRRIFLMITALVGPESIYSASIRENTAANHDEFEALQSLIIGTLDNFTNAILLIASTSIQVTSLILEQISWLLQLYLNQNAEQCGPFLLPMAIYSLCNMLNIILQLRFPDSNVQVSGDVLIKIKKNLCALVNKLDLNKDGNNVICTEIIRCLVAVTTPNKMLALDNVQKHQAGIVADTTTENELEASHDDLSDLDEEMMDEDDEEDDEDHQQEEEEDSEEELDEDDSEVEDSDLDAEDEDLDEDDSDDDDESSDSAIDEDELGSDIEEDVEMALPHQIDEDYVMNPDNDSSSNSSLGDVGEDEEDDDDGPRIRVVGELDEQIVQDATVEDELPRMGISEDIEPDSDFSASPSDGFEHEPARASAENGHVFTTSGESNVNFQEHTDQNRTIHIEIQFGDSQGVRYNVDNNASSNLFGIPPETRNQDQNQSYPSNHAQHSVRTGSWYIEGDLQVPTKNTSLPPTRRQVGGKPDVNAQLVQLLGTAIPTVTLSKPLEPQNDHPVTPSPQAGLTEAPEEDDEDHHIERMASIEMEQPPTVAQEPPQVPSPTTSPSPDPIYNPDTGSNTYFNEDLDRIARALGISFNDLFTLANMDPGVISELPVEMREEILLQQLNTINVDAVERIRTTRQSQTCSGTESSGQDQSLAPSNPPPNPPPQSLMQYLEALPRSLRLDAVRGIYGEGSGEINAALDFGDNSDGVLAALAPSLRQGFLTSARAEFWDSIAANLLGGSTSGFYNRGIASRTRSQQQGRSGDGREMRDHPSRSPETSSNAADQLATGLTLGFIIGEIRDGNQGRQRGGNTQRNRAGLNRRSGVSAASLSTNRRRSMGNSGRNNSILSANINDIIFLDNHMMRSRNGMDNLPHGAHLRDGNFNSRDQITRPSSSGFGGAIMRSMPQLFNSFQPHLLNFMQPGSRLSANADTNEAYGAMDTSGDSFYNNHMETIYKLVPNSVTDMRAVGGSRSFLEFIKIAKCDLNSHEAAAITKMLFLKQELNKKLYFKLLYNLMVAGGPNVDIILKFLLHVLYAGLVNIEPCKSGKFEDVNIYKPCIDGFPPQNLYGSIQQRPNPNPATNAEPAGLGTIGSLWQSNTTNLLSHVGSGSNSASFVSTERVLEQLRSILIALPFTATFFSRYITMDETSESRRKKKRINHKPGMYPINFLLRAAGSNLFQSSIKHMNHLVMVLHNLLVVVPDQANPVQPPSENGSASRVQDETTPPPAEKPIQTDILRVLDSESITEFLRIFCNWQVQSNYVVHCNNKDTLVQNQLLIVSQILASIYNHSDHESLVDTTLQCHLKSITNEITARLSIQDAILMRNTEIEHQLLTLLRLVNFINEMFSEAYKNHQQSCNGEKAKHLMITAQFYSRLELQPLWETMDNVLSCILPGVIATEQSVGVDDVSLSNTEALTVMEPLIESFFQIWQNSIALEYNLDSIQELDQTISLVNFDAEIPKNINFDIPTPQRILELEASNISPSHGTLICFAERHKRAIGILIKQNPALLSSGFQALIRLAPLCLGFETKRQYFRQKLKERRQGLRLDTIRLNVRRERIFLDSYHQLRSRTGDEMKGKLSVVFGGEEGVDAGGLTREWFAILAKEMFNPNYGLFRREGRKQEFNHPNPLSGINPDHLNFFKFIGRIIGKALYDGHHLDAYFCRSFYKHMLGRKITPADAESVDPQFFANLMSLTQYTLESLGLELYFSTEIDEFGKVKVIDLIPNGRNIPVTEDNKHKYIELLCQHKVTNGIKDQLDAFMEGFYELISPRLISIFDDKELELLISGIPIIDLQNLKENVEYVNYDAESDQIVWLWEFLEQLDQNHLAAFLQFVTGTSRVPIGGFKNLMGMRGPQKISIHKTFGDDRLPTAHTCFNQLDLPAYSQKNILFDKLLQAIVEGKEGFGFI